MKKNIFKVMFTALALAVLVTACGKADNTKDEIKTTEVVEESKGENETKYPLEVEVFDEKGKEHTQKIDKAPEKVVTGNLSSIEMLMELGVGDKIVGTLDPDNKVTGKWEKDIEKLNSIGDKTNASKEVVAGLEPDIYIGRSTFLNDNSLGSIETLNGLGINVYTQKASNASKNPELSAVIDDVKTLGEIFDVQDRAEEYAKELEARQENVIKNVEEKKGDKPLNAMVMVKYDDSAKTFSVFSMKLAGVQKNVLNTLNVKPLIEDGGDSFNFETLIKNNPDVIIYITADRNAETDKVAKESLLNESMIKDVPAIKNKKIIEIGYDDLMDYGVRLYDSLEYLNEEIYGK